MSHPQPLSPDVVRLKREIAQADVHGRPISCQTARELASWFAEAHGPGFRTFLTTGLVTSQLHTELTRLYDQRSEEAGHWLANLARFVLSQPVDSQPRRRARRATPEDTR
ncbi:hypothetical protein AB0A74_09525 [Saccharothrix sp. NPDC042600]|uniref:hypothetical protein n=1 Tax=Saccharothrix TaxID=2071 RepID=UPI0033E0F395|nr:hypothetical protein GCM10017745_35350 [Saccharothrix mutabilis subsp. capreolus]